MIGFRAQDDEIRSLQRELDLAVLSTIRAEALQSIEFIDQLLLRKCVVAKSFKYTYAPIPFN